MAKVLGCGAQMDKLLNVSSEDVQAIEDSIGARVKVGVSHKQAQVQAVEDAISAVIGEKTEIIRAIERQVAPKLSGRIMNPDDIDDLGAFNLDNYDFDKDYEGSIEDELLEAGFGVSGRNIPKTDFSKVKKKDIDAAGLMPERLFPVPDFVEDDSGDLVAKIAAGGKEHTAKILGYGGDGLWRVYAGDMAFDGNGAPVGASNMTEAHAKEWFAKAAASIELKKRGFDLLKAVAPESKGRIADFWSRLGKRPDALEMPVDAEVDGKAMEQLQKIADKRLAGKGIDFEVEASGGQLLVQMHKSNGDTDTALIEMLRSIKGQQAVTLHTTGFAQGSGVGKLFYGIANAWAKQNNILVVADEMGLTHVNGVRRTENGLSSAARTSGEAHVLPGVAQRVYGFKEGKKPEQQRDNLVRLALAQLRNVMEVVPEIATLRYDLASDRFTGVEDDVQSRLVAGNKVQRILARGDVRQVSIGRSSLARAALTQELMTQDVVIPEKVAKPVLYSERGTLEYHDVEDMYKGTEQWLRAPNGKPTRLTERQWVQTRTPSFLNWFGDWMKFAAMEGGVWSDGNGEVSKAVDENGEPLVLFHGASNGGFMTFKQPGGKKRGDIGIFATPNLDMAESYVRRGRVKMIEHKQHSQSDLEEMGYQFEDEDDAIRVTEPDGYQLQSMDSGGLFRDMQSALSEANETLTPEAGDQPGVYALFANIREPYESDFEGATWSGSREHQWVVELAGDIQTDGEGRMYFDSVEEAAEFAETFRNPDDESFDPGDYVRGADEHYETTDDVAREGIDSGDGAIVRNVVDDGGGPSSYMMEPADVFILKDPDQVKSADFNTGAFGKVNDIRYSERKEAAIGDTTDISKLENGRRIPDSVSVGGLDSSLKIAASKKYATGRDLKLDIQAAVLDAAKAARVSLTTKTKALHKFLSDMVVKDALYSLQSNQNAVGWYDEKVGQALAAIAVIHPEINTEAESRLAFLWALAVTSNGIKVEPNFALANKAYAAWKASGDKPANRTMPSNIGIGNAASKINEGLDLFNKVTRGMGLKDAERFMVSRFLAGDITKMLGIKPTGEWADTPVSGASILGPKIGNGFFMNLNGYFDALTMDRWLMRAFGRLTGTLINIDKKDIAAKRASLKLAIKAMSPDAKTILGDMIELKLNNGMTNDQVETASKAIAKAATKPKNREVMNSLLGGEEFRKAANNLYRALDGSNETPSGPSERNWIRAIFGTALESLKKQGYDLTMSDLQALLWYPERRLYDAAKSDEVVEGYEDDDAPDYANAAYKLAVKLGADADEVRSAMNAAKGTKRTEPMSEIEKDGLITRMAFELAPDPAKPEQMDAWSAMTDKQREDATKKVRSQIVPSILDLFGVKISTRAMELGSGGFMGHVNPNIQADFGFQTIDADTAKQIAAAIGYALDQASVALVDKRLVDSPVEVIRLTFDKNPSKHAKQIFEAINKAVPEIDGFSIRGNNFDVLNFTGIPNKDIVSRLTQALDGIGLPMVYHGKSGQLNSMLVERGDYERHLGRIRSDDSGRVLRQRLDGLREVAASYIGGRAGDRPSRSGGLGRAGAARLRDSPVQQAGEKGGGAGQAAGAGGRGIGRGAPDSQLLPEQSEVAGRNADEGPSYSERLKPLDGAPNVPGFHGPDPRLVGVADVYAKSIGIRLKRQSEYVAIDASRATRLADAYAAMSHSPSDPVVKEAYQNLIRQTMSQYQALADAGYKFWFIDFAVDGNDAYAASPWNAMRDIRANQQMGIFPTSDGFGSDAEFDAADNPLMANTGLMWPSGGPSGPMRPVLANDVFRAVHDAFGHGLEGAGFRAQGEENAWQAHVRLFTGSAVGAITSETRGQNSWVNYGPHAEHNRTASGADTRYADQKVGLLPEWAWTDGVAGDARLSARDNKAAEAAGFDASVTYYHGTAAKDFKGFRAGKKGINELGEGIYFTSIPMYADAWAGREGRVIPAYLKKGDLFDSSGFGMAHRGVKSEQMERWFKPLAKRLKANNSPVVGDGNEDLWKTWLSESDEVLADHLYNTTKTDLNTWLARAGYVGRVDENSQIPGQVVVFRPEHIRSPWARFDPTKADKANILYSTRDDLGFYSELSDQVGKSTMKQAPAPAWKTFIKALTQKGVKPDEIEWSGVNEWLDLQEGKVPKQAVVDFIDQNGVRVTETVLGNDADFYRKKYEQAFEALDALEDEIIDEIGGTSAFQRQTISTLRAGRSTSDVSTELQDKYAKAFDTMKEAEADSLNKSVRSRYGQYTLPGGENYREVLLTLPSKEDAAKRERFSILDENGNILSQGMWPPSARSQARIDANPQWRVEREMVLDQNDTKRKGLYKSSHFEQPNILAHIRVDDRVDADGNKVLFVEEIQSDHQQDYRKSKEAISKAVDADFNGIVARMKAAGVLEVNCD